MMTVAASTGGCSKNQPETIKVRVALRLQCSASRIERWLFIFFPFFAPTMRMMIVAASTNYKG